MKKLFGKKKIDEKKMVKWVNKTLEGGSDIEQIGKVLEKKYDKKDVAAFLKKNYSVEPEVKDKKLEKGLEEEKAKKEEEDELDAEMDALKEEAAGEEPEEVVTPGEVPEAPEKTPKGTKEEPERIEINDMSSLKMELFKQVMSINQGIQELVKLSKK